MQQSYEFKTTWYFVIGSPQKSSLSSQFCRQNNFIHFNNPKIENLKADVQKHALIEGSTQLFYEIEKTKAQLSVILVGKTTNEHQQKICHEYKQIGRFKHCPSYKYEQFRKKVFPNLIFVYGPLKDQNNEVAQKLASNIGYTCSFLLKDSNDYISHVDKSLNYVINDLFNDPNQLRILAQYFQLRVIHLKYNRVDLPNLTSYFDNQFALISYMKDKPFYIPVSATQTQFQIFNDIGALLCPKIIYAHPTRPEHYKKIQRYAQQNDSLLLDIEHIQQINKRKKIPLLQNPKDKLLYLSSIFYKDLTKKQIIIVKQQLFPLEKILTLQKINRKISLFVDFTESSQYSFSKQYSTPIYFLQLQKWKRPHPQLQLKDELQSKIQYWLVGGAGGSGKTTVAKFMSSQFGFKLIQFQTYLAVIKEKLIAPEDGEELPVKKVIQHFRQLLNNDKNSTYVIDGLPYSNKDLQDWIKVIGPPNVLYLQVDTNQQIKRGRKKAEGDLSAPISQQQTGKSKESSQKCLAWLHKIQTFCPSSSIYKLDFNGPQIMVENQIAKILRPRIFLIQKNRTNVYQNIALKFDLGFINLNKNRLRQCEKQVKNCKKRDILICNHGHQKGRIISEDLYWVEKNLGPIRYVGIWQPQNKQAAVEMMVLQKPKVAQKPKAVEGESEQKPPQEVPVAEGEGEGGKKKLDIYDYEWTKPGDYKNLSQWFLKYKKNVKQYSGTPEECFKRFEKVLEDLNSSSEVNVYEAIK